MTIKRFKPITPSLRHRTIVDRSLLWKGGPFKKLSEGLTKSGGRNHHGRITVRHRGGGHKRLYRIIDFKRSLFQVRGKVSRLEYDPNRSSWIALVTYEDGSISYILAPDGIKVGDWVFSSKDQGAPIEKGNAICLKHIPIGTLIHNVELKPGKGGQIIRSAGSYGRVIQKRDGYCMVRLPSGMLRLIPSTCMATIGIISNVDHHHVNQGKAGHSRWIGRRPSVRGTAMNPIDHPHGGGEGKTSGGRPSVTPWGKPTKGKPTRSKKKKNPFLGRTI